MRAARYYGKEDIRVEEIPEPECKPDQLKIRPAFVGICGTDLHEYLGGPTFAPVTPHPVTKETIPITFGHEFSGVVTSVGSSVTGFKPGQHVSIQPTIYDTTCPACLQNHPNVCHNGGFIGLSGWGGGLSDSVTVPATSCLPLPENIPLDIAALIEPLAVGWHAVSQSPIGIPSPRLSDNNNNNDNNNRKGKGGENVLILGGGPIGIAVILALRAKGVGRIFVSEISAQRQVFDREFGADEVWDPREVDVEERVKEETGGEGVDVVFDCAGVEKGLRTACRCVRVKGTVVNVAIWEKPISFQPNDLVFREGRYVACLGYVKQDFKDVIEAISTGKMSPGKMITSKIPLERVVEDGIKELIRNKERHVKVLVQI